MSRRQVIVLAVLFTVLLSTGVLVVRNLRDRPLTPSSAASVVPVVPAPAHAELIEGATFALTAGTAIVAAPEAAAVAGQLADLLRPATGFPLGVRATAGPPAIRLALDGATPDDGYTLDVTGDGVTLRGGSPAGLFAGVQTLRQLLPPAIESRTVQPGPWPVPGVHIVDQPRYPYRGAMLDVARHFFGVPDVMRFIDHLALYKFNHLHLHLSDDQGWRLAIDGWPRLAEHGGRTQVGGGPGGYYTKAQYAELVAYARQRFVTVVPEIDLPGHTNAALAAYPELTCDGQPRELYTGVEVGFSAVCPNKDVTYSFVTDVLTELAALTPGPYLHIGGDEVETMDPAEYTAFVARTQGIVERLGKRVMGWHQMAVAAESPGRVLQYWAPGRSAGGGAHDGADAVAEAVRAGARVVLSPADRTYLDMKYDDSSPLGTRWAGTVDLERAYGWDPGAYLSDVDPGAILGVEAPLWTETLDSLADLEVMLFPRLAAIAELAWSPAERHDWPAFQARLGRQEQRWTALGIAFHDSP